MFPVSLWGLLPTPPRAGSVYFQDPIEWRNVIYYPVSPSHSTYCGGFVGLRDDVGIVPYILAGLRTIQRPRFLGGAGVLGTRSLFNSPIFSPGGWDGFCMPHKNKHPQ